MDKALAERAGRLIKIIHLAQSPMSDSVSIKLNCGLTYDEQRAAQRWMRAFELAKEEGSLFDLAAKLYEETK